MLILSYIYLQTCVHCVFFFFNVLSDMEMRLFTIDHAAIQFIQKKAFFINFGHVRLNRTAKHDLANAQVKSNNSRLCFPCRNTSLLDIIKLPLLSNNDLFFDVLFLFLFVKEPVHIEKFAFPTLITAHMLLHLLADFYFIV